MSAAWPKHADGRPMRLGEIPQPLRGQIEREALRRVVSELNASADAFGAVIGRPVAFVTGEAADAAAAAIAKARRP